MGIVNATPDSFSDGGENSSVENALNHILSMREQGVDIIDIGGESTRPGAAEVSAGDEWERVGPILEELATRDLGLPISIDTYKAEVATKAISVGATIINDVWGAQRDPEIASVTADAGLPFIAMHWDPGRDRDKDIIDEMKRYFSRSLDICTRAGIDPKQIVLDPGFGFAKSVRENYELLKRLDELQDIGSPLLIGTSRKSMIGKLLNVPTDQRLSGTIASNVVAYQKGGHIFRVHDVKAHRDALSVTHAALYGAPDLE